LSYQSFKRVLGESNLERKCRRLFGACLMVLITGSFWWYGSETDQMVYKLNRIVGHALVTSAMMEAHNNALVTNPDEQKANRSLTELLRGRAYVWQMLRADVKPENGFEWELINEWSQFADRLKAQRGLTDDAIDEALANPDNDLIRDKATSDKSTYNYTYYQPVFAKKRCVTCHGDVPAAKFHMPGLQIGDLMAVVRVRMDNNTQNAQAANRALLITLGVMTVALAMLALYVIVRYVIVKPLAHLRDVSDAVRRGDVEQRAVIHTGDEFEEVGAAFNRMLRQLLRQQDELRAVNGELDTKIDELAQVNMRLFELNKVKSDFLATVSHELRTPLNSILGFSDLLASVKTLEDKQRRYATNIERSGRQLLDMINHMLDLAKLESGRMEVRPVEFDVGTVVQTQCDLARPLSERKHIELDCEIAPDLPPMLQDRGKLEQIINNLLSNAVKFTPDGGRIHVAARRDRRGDLRLSVADTGVGISESEQSVVFEKFRQGASAISGGNAMTREFSGSGLGLSIVRELCRLLGGDVTLESELGRGSEFTVMLPWTYAEAEPEHSPLEDELRLLAGARTAPSLANGGADI